MSTTKPNIPQKPIGPLQARILEVLREKEASAQQITDTLNSDPTAKPVTLASVRDSLYRGLVKRRLVEKLPVAFSLVKRGKK